MPCEAADAEQVNCVELETNYILQEENINIFNLQGKTTNYFKNTGWGRPTTEIERVRWTESNI